MSSDGGSCDRRSCVCVIETKSLISVITIVTPVTKVCSRLIFIK